MTGLRMRRLRQYGRCALAAGLVFFSSAAVAQYSASTSWPSAATLSFPAAKAVQARKPFAPSLPLYFEKNDGQIDRSASFMARMPGATLYLTGADAVLVHSSKANHKASALRMHWVDAAATTTPEGEAEMTARSNYFIGNDHSRWHTNVANFQRVRQNELYPGVDLVYYGNQQQLEYDLTVHPGASPSAIQLQIEGANSIKLDKATGDLLLVDAIGSPLRLLKPVVYQLGDNNERTSIAGAYALSARNTVSVVLGNYDHSRELVIDPEVSYSTVFGGTLPATTGYSFGNYFNGMAVDPSGNVYLGGESTADNLPTTSGSYQPTCNTYTNGGVAACSNFYVAKFDPTQSGAASLIYATYIGANIEVQSAGISNLAVDSNGDAYFTGDINTPASYPTTSNAYAPACNLTSAPTGSACPYTVLTKLNPSGSALLYSSWLLPYFHGRAPTEASMIGVGGPSDSIAVVGDQGGGIILAYDTNQSGAGSFLYEEFVPFEPLGIAVDSMGNAYVGGSGFQSTQNGTNSNQGIDLNGAQTTAPARVDPGILVKFNTSGQNTYATLFGQGNGDDVYSVSVDADGTAYAVGNAVGLTQVNGLSSGSASSYGAFVAKVDTTQTGTASLLYSTYINSGDEAGIGYGISSNGAGLIAFGMTATPTSEYAATEQTYPLMNPLVQPVNYPEDFSSSDPYVGVVGVIDTTKSGQQALIFLSFLDGVEYPYVVDLGQTGSSVPVSTNLYVGGYAGTGYAGSPFLGVAGSYLTSISYAASPESQTTYEFSPFFYAISLDAADVLELSPPFLTFPNQEENTTSPPLPFTVTNTTSAPVDISSVTASSQFGETDNCVTSPIAAGQNCTVKITFQPDALSTSLSPTTGTVSVAVSGYSNPMVEGLTGVGVSSSTPTAWLSPASINFGSEPDGGIDGPVQVMLTNNGTITLTGFSSGPLLFLPNGAFVLAAPTSSPTCGDTLAAGASCYFAVAFEPTTTTYSNNGSNNYSQQLSVNFNTSHSLSMPLTGTGGPAAPKATLSPITLTFPSTSPGSSSGPQSVTLTNTGSLPMTGISVGPVAGADTSSFSVSGGCLTTTSLAVGANCTLNVTFIPQAIGSLTANVTFTDNATPASQTVSFTGTGAATLLNVDETIHFSDAPALRASTPLNVAETVQISDAGLVLNPSTLLNIAEDVHFTDWSAAPAELMSPTPGSTLPGSSVTFAWSTGIGVTLYQLCLSAIAPGECDLFSYKGAAMSATASTLPANGAIVYATLYSYINRAWQHNNYLYTGSGTAIPAILQSPTPGLSTVVGASNVLFQWNAGTGVTLYQLNLSATAPGESELFSYKGQAMFVTASSLPANGITLYARLYSYIGGAWQYNDYVYTESGTPLAVLQSPTPGLTTVLGTSEVVFQWSRGVGVSDYQLNLSAIAPGESELFSYKGSATTANAPILPANGVKVYARLYSYISGAWVYNDYVYTESGSAVPAVLQSPLPGLTTVLGTSNVPFQWSTGTGVTLYQLNLSAVAPGEKELFSYKGTATTATAPILPANGVKVYARLYSYIGGAWVWNDYVYTEQ
jgi:hypothetical protein